MIVVCIIITAILLFLVFQDADLTLLLHELIFARLGIVNSRLKNKTVWIIGASSGIGKLLAIKLAKLKCKLILTATNEKNLNFTKQLCVDTGKVTHDDILVLPFDISNEQDQAVAWKQIVDKFGNIDILVNNAGRIYFSHFVEDSMQTDMKLFAINTFANVNISRLVVKHWLAQKSKGQIMVTTSMAAFVVTPLMHVYNASKRALHAYYDAMRIELAGSGIDICLVVPGPVASQLYENSLIDESKKHEKGVELNTMSTSRCVNLIKVALACRLNQAWICKSPILYWNYFHCYAPFLSQKILHWVMFDWVKRKIERQVFKTK